MTLVWIAIGFCAAMVVRAVVCHYWKEWRFWLNRVVKNQTYEILRDHERQYHIGKP